MRQKSDTSRPCTGGDFMLKVSPNSSPNGCFLMGMEETSPVNSSRPSLPPKPEVPPKPGLRGGRGQMARPKSLPSFPNDPRLSQSEVPLSFCTRVKPRPAPKPRRRKTFPRQDSISPAAEKKGVSIATLLKSTDGCNSGEPASNKHESRLWRGDSGSNRDSPFSESQPGCAALCPSTCPSNSDPHHAAKLQYNTHLNCRRITSLSAPGRSARVRPKIPLPARPLPKEPPLISIQDTKDQPDVPEGVYIEIDASPSDVDDRRAAVVLCSRRLGFPLSPVGDLGAADRLSHSNKHRFIPPVPAKPLPTLKTQSTTKGKESRKNNDGLRSSILAELKEKLPSSGEEIKSGTEPHTRKWMNGKTRNVLCKKTPTNEMALSSSMKKTLLLAELKSVSFKSKNSTQHPQAVNNQAPTVLANLVRNSGADVDVKEEPSDEVYDLLSPVTALDIQDSLEQEDYMLHQEYDGPDPRSTPVDAMGRIAVGRQHGSLKRFWQEQSIVLDSGVLSQLSKQQLLLQESMYEVVTTEQSYLESLNVAVNVFMESPDLNRALAPRDLKSLFSSLGRIREISHNFLESLKGEMEKNPFFDVCEVICLHASAHFATYVDYIRNMPYQEQTLHHLGKENSQIEEILRELQEDPRCNRLSLKSFLVLPFQRITRLKILVQTILIRTEPGSEHQASAELALKEVSKVVEACNYEVGRMKQMEEMVLIANKTEFECKALPLVSSSRWLVKQGELDQLIDKENIFGQRKVSQVYLLLFNDLLLVAIKKGLDRFVVQDHVHRSLIEISDGMEEEKGDCKLASSFVLTLLKDHRGVTSQRLLRAPSQAEKNSWVEALRPQKNGEDDVYEEWDCPQVECIADYCAQQPGELSLQIGNILNVIQKTNDGYLEARRLVDGERGWFPRHCVEEIVDEHVQRRNLRQCYHVLQAASRILSRRVSCDRYVSTCLRAGPRTLSTEKLCLHRSAAV